MTEELSDNPEVLKAAGKLMDDMDKRQVAARVLTDLELGKLLLMGKWSTIEVHEAARRLMGRP